MLIFLQTKADTKNAWHIPWVLLTVLGILAVSILECLAEEVIDERPIARQVVLEAVLGNKAMLSIEGKSQLLAIGKPGVEGVYILRISPEVVDVMVDGQRRKLRLGGNNVVTNRYKQRKDTTVTISRSANGMYSTVGSINGLTVSFLVDTGATTIAMNADHARRLAIDYRVVGDPTFVGTASGVAKAYRVTLDTVTVGKITMRNISAVVMDGKFPTQVLLGMSFLGRLEIQREGAIMRLKKKF